MRRIVTVDLPSSILESARKALGAEFPQAQIFESSAATFAVACVSNGIDMVLLHQPRADFSVLQSIRTRCPRVPIVAVFGDGPFVPDLAQEALSRGATDFCVPGAEPQAAFQLALQRSLKYASLSARLSQSEEELRVLRAACERKKEFLAAVTHDLRTPLVSMRIYAQFLASGRMGPLSAAQKDKVEAISKNADRLTHCIDAIQRFERLEAPAGELVLTNFDLCEVLSEALAAVTRLSMEKGISLGRSWPSEPVQVHADRELIVEALAALLENAVHFTGDKGSIALAIVPRADREICVSITDSGCGIPPAKLPHVFECRWHGPAAAAAREAGQAREKPGLGLGLPTVKRILDLHGSKIELDSRPGVGVRFRFTLPLSKAAAPGPILQNAPQLSGSGGERNESQVLVVDDDEDNLACLRSVLEFAGYRVLSASGFNEARAQLEDGSVDAVLLDIAMADVSGMDTLRSLKHYPATSSLPVLMVSGCSDDAVRSQALALGASAFIVKPYQPAKLLKELRAAIAQPLVEAVDE